jgi:hypothetical protein
LSDSLKYMSKLFFDHLIELKEIERQIKKVAKTSEEKEELWALVDEIVHHKVMGCILDKLPKDNHEEFLQMFHKSPHDTELIFEYLRIKAGDDVELLIKKEIDNLSGELLEDLKLND